MIAAIGFVLYCIGLMSAMIFAMFGILWLLEHA